MTPTLHQAAQQQQVGGKHGRDRQQETDQQLEVGMEGAVGHDATGWSTLSDIVRGSRQLDHVGIDEVGSHDQRAHEPEDETHHAGITICPIRERLERVRDRQVTVYAHYHHGEDAGVRVDAVEGTHDLAEDDSEDPGPAERAVCHKGQT